MSEDGANIRVEIEILKVQLKNLHDDMVESNNYSRQEIQELKIIQKQLVEFMYTLKGGKTWLFSLLTIAAIVGGFVSHAINYFVKV